MSREYTASAERTVSPFRGDVVGSFLRPQEIRQARAKFFAGAIGAEELRQAEDSAILDLVKKEKAAGLKAVTDGEFRRSWWHLDFMWGLDGIEKSEVGQGYAFHNETTRAETARLSGKIRFQSHPFLEHFRFLKNAAGADVTARQTIPAPAQLLAELQRPENLDATRRIYGSPQELDEDIAAAYRGFIQALYGLGCRSLQLDDCTWGMLCDQKFREAASARHENPDETAAQYAALNNAALEGKPADLTVTTHVCRGNYHSTWAGSGGYEPVAEILFGRENVSAYYLEFDTERAGGFAPLRFVGDGKLVVLGLISSKTGVPEEEETIRKRIEEAAQFVPLDRLCLSPQCGFASTEEGNVLTEEQQWNKVRLVQKIAGDVWGK